MADPEIPETPPTDAPAEALPEAPEPDPKPDPKSVALHFRMGEDDSARLDKLCADYGLPKAVVARRAMQIGIAVIEDHAAALRLDAKIRISIGHEDE